MTFGANLRRIRDRRGMSQKSLAAAIGSTQGQIAALEADRFRTQMVDTVLRLSDALDCTPGDLLEGVRPASRAHEASREAAS